jgi:hypothetical protein
VHNQYFMVRFLVEMAGEARGAAAGTGQDFRINYLHVGDCRRDRRGI